MTKKMTKPILDLSNIDIDTMNAVQTGLDRQNRLLAGAGVFQALHDQLRQIQEPAELMRQILEEHSAASQAIRDLVEREERMFGELRRYEEMLRPHMEGMGLVARNLRDMDQSLKDIVQPFDPAIMGTIVGGVVADVRMSEYLGLFDFKMLQGFVEQFPETPEPEAELEETREDEVQFEPSLQVQVISAISDALIEHFHRHPGDMRSMQPRLFEELVAELISGQGFEVELTQQTRDGGYDIVAVKHDLFATRHLIECKRYAEGRPVGVREVRALHGVVTAEGASKGVIVTTSRLSRDAALEVEKHPWRLGKTEYQDLKVWILAYLKRKSAGG